MHIPTDSRKPHMYTFIHHIPQTHTHTHYNKVPQMGSQQRSQSADDKAMGTGDLVLDVRMYVSGCVGVVRALLLFLGIATGKSSYFTVFTHFLWGCMNPSHSTNSLVPRP